jgi:hypothetical protein
VVDRWLAQDKITSYGPSGIGFVKFETTKRLEVMAAIETFGQGARGFNVYAGRVDSAEFDRIAHADGAVALQVSQPIGQIPVQRGIETFGGLVESLVKGVVVKLPVISEGSDDISVFAYCGQGLAGLELLSYNKRSTIRLDGKRHLRLISIGV